MITQELLNYIKEQLQRSTSKEDIERTLLSNGWTKKDIDEGFITGPDTPVNTPPQQTNSLNASVFLGAFSLLAETWAIYRKRFIVFWTILFIPSFILVIPFFILVTLGVVSTFSSTFFLSFFLQHFTFSILSFVLLGILGLLFLILITAIQIWGTVSLLYAIKDTDEGIGVLEAYRRGRHKILSYWWVSVLVGFITFGGGLLLLVPGIIFYVWFSVAFFILIAENTGGMSALLKSREYIRGRWWGVLSRLSFIFFLSFLISLVPYILNILKIPFLNVFLSFFIPLIVTPFILTYLFSMYRSLQATKGEFTFTPTLRRKVAFIAIGFLGIILILTLPFTLSLVNRISRPEQQNLLNQGTEVTDQDTANWQTYRNKKFGFELKYPDGFQAAEGVRNLQSVDAIASFSTGPSVFNRRVSIFILTTSLEKEIESNKSILGEPYSVTDFNLDSVQAKKLVYKSSSILGSVTVLVPVSSFTLSITMSNFSDFQVDQILSTFHFIEIKDETASREASAPVITTLPSCFPRILLLNGEIQDVGASEGICVVNYMVLGNLDVIDSKLANVIEDYFNVKVSIQRFEEEGGSILSWPSGTAVLEGEIDPIVKVLLDK